MSIHHNTSVTACSKRGGACTSKDENVKGCRDDNAKNRETSVVYFYAARQGSCHHCYGVKWYEDVLVLWDTNTDIHNRPHFNTSSQIMNIHLRYLFYHSIISCYKPALPIWNTYGDVNAYMILASH